MVHDSPLILWERLRVFDDQGSTDAIRHSHNFAPFHSYRTECKGHISRPYSLTLYRSLKWANVRFAATPGWDTIIAAILFWLSPFIVLFLIVNWLMRLRHRRKSPSS